MTTASQVERIADAAFDRKEIEVEREDERAGELSERIATIARLIANDFGAVRKYGGEIDFSLVRVDLYGDGAVVMDYYDAADYAQATIGLGHEELCLPFMRRRREALIKYLTEESAFVELRAMRELGIEE